ncbi:unnamed protein product [Tilletia laevis]|uniref:Ribosomal protein mS38 C-terminal domain-containing protein n=3 Tax=Tilletia TaxID=13289 RepID=A0A8X7MSY8_9BASI|nr:hypothetical protein CF336_g7435 [Tilletia laevis]KAE8195435.1 hypothetical protein CF328_g4439 [Tilletia controversa]KAE8247189.1 hypothetical protein A4X03_0g7119 [Tilletia caries]KAE8185546.1 hypothetical protein CF335_g7691 [Tilletia laevis]KAE8247620.1 hypothetical protein A4X06_0g4314 [Tilletia controversa]
MQASRAILSAVARSSPAAAALDGALLPRTPTSWAVSSPLLHRSRAWRSSKGGITYSASSSSSSARGSAQTHSLLGRAPSHVLSPSYEPNSAHLQQQQQQQQQQQTSSSASTQPILHKLEHAIRLLQRAEESSSVELDSVKRKRRKKMRKHKLKKLRKVQRSERQRLKK